MAYMMTGELPGIAVRRIGIVAIADSAPSEILSIDEDDPRNELTFIYGVKNVGDAKQKFTLRVLPDKIASQLKGLE